MTIITDQTDRTCYFLIIISVIIIFKYLYILLLWIEIEEVLIVKINGNYHCVYNIGMEQQKKK